MKRAIFRALVSLGILSSIGLSSAQDASVTEDEEKALKEALKQLAEGINPAEIWYEQGKELVKKYNIDKCDFGLGPGVFKGALAQLPRYFPDAKKVMDLETRLGWCLQQYAGMAPEQVRKFAMQCWGKTNCFSEYEAMVTYLSMESNGYKFNVNLKDPQVKKMYELGKKVYYARMGPWDFNCATCHAGKQQQRIRASALWSIDRGEVGSAVNKFPIYRVSWNQVFPMHYRYAECLRQTRLPYLKPHSDIAVALSTYLYGSANGTEIKVPAIAR